MPGSLLRAARDVAERLEREGHRAWLVGGVVRDLALGREPHDADLVTAAMPDEVEACFERTIAVGKAFGTIVVCIDDLRLEVTTFRTEGAYTDGRRPDAVSYGTTPADDATRRDFTCNAMFLDPVSDEFLDPTDGLLDLRHGRLRCVGNAFERFAEDGLRLMRLARLSAALELEVEDETFEGAQSNAGRIESISGERILAEWTRIADGPGPARAARILERTGVLGHLSADPDAWDVGRVERLGAAPGVGRLLATLLDPARGGRDALTSWNPSRALLRGIEDIWALEGELARILALGVASRRSERIRLVRDAAYADALAVYGTRFEANAIPAGLVELAQFARDRTDAELHPEPYLIAADFEASNVTPGPEWGRLLREAEDLQLDGVLTSRRSALDWLRSNAN